MIFANVDLYLGRAVSDGVNVLLWHIINLVSSETFQVHHKVFKKTAIISSNVPCLIYFYASFKCWHKINWNKHFWDESIFWLELVDFHRVLKLWFSNNADFRVLKMNLNHLLSKRSWRKSKLFWCYFRKLYPTLMYIEITY